MHPLRAAAGSRRDRGDGRWGWGGAGSIDPIALFLNWWEFFFPCIKYLTNLLIKEDVQKRYKQRKHLREEKENKRTKKLFNGRVCEGTSYNKIKYKAIKGECPKNYICIIFILSN